MNRYFLLFLTLFFAVTANAETWTFPTEVDNAILQTTEGIQVCTGTGDLVLATGCTGGGTQYTITFDASDGSFSFPSTLSFTGGTAASPGISLSGDSNTGIYSTSADHLQISTGGTERVRINNNGTDIRSGQLLISTGTVGSPGFGIRGDSDTGIYWGGSTGQLAVASDGSNVATFDSGGLTVASGSSLDFADATTVLETAGVDRYELRGSDGGIRFLTSSAPIIFRSPDGSYSSCTVDNSDNFTCTGL